MTTVHLTTAPARPDRLGGRAAPVAVGVVALGACMLLGAVDPGEPGRYPLCPFRLATGLDCPGCGTLRAVHALVGGDVLAAADHNLATLLLLPVLVAAWVRWLLGRPPGRKGGSALGGYAVALSLGAFWVVRNVPAAPWEWLASGAG